MLFLGRVYRNSKFGEEGTIDVMLFQKYRLSGSSREMEKGLYDRASEIKEAIGNSDSSFDALTVKCLVSSEVGNAYNTGSFHIPQIGMLGLVEELDSDTRFGNGIGYIWLGGIYGNKQYGEKVILPNDDTDYDNIDYEDKCLIKDEDDNKDTITESDYIQKGMFLIKTKTCKIDDYDNINGDSLDYKNIPGENTFVMKKNKSALRHNVYDGNFNKTGYAHLSLEDDKIRINRITGTASNGYSTEQNIVIDENSIAIEFINDSDNKSVKLKMNNDGTVNLDTSGSITVNCGKNADIKVSGNANVTTNGTMKLESRGKMTITACGVNLAQVIYKLAENVKYLQTFGNPSTHATMPTSQLQISSTESYMLTGFNK